MTRALIFLIFILGFSRAFSQDECPVETGLPEVSSLIHEIHHHLDRHAATDDQIMNAFCKTLSPPTFQEVSRFIDSKTGRKKKDGIIHGVEFEDESPVHLEAFKRLTTARNALNIVDWPKDQVAVQETYSINPECKKVRCAVEKIWGQELGLKLLYMLEKHSFNGSDIAFSHSKAFSHEEIDDVLMALEDIPQHFSPLGEPNQRLGRFSFPPAPENQGVIANANIWLFDLWTEQSRPKKQYTVYHELSHNVAIALKKIDKSEEWLELSGWVRTNTKPQTKVEESFDNKSWSFKGNACHASTYGSVNPEEDFAESMSAYRYSPQEFKKRCPEKYNFLKEKVYKGLEYTSTEACSP